MRTPNEYRQLAARHRADAQTAESVTIRKLHLSLAEAYDELAEQIASEPDAPC